MLSNADQKELQNDTVMAYMSIINWNRIHIHNCFTFHFEINVVILNYHHILTFNSGTISTMTKFVKEETKVRTLHSRWCSTTVTSCVTNYN